MDYSEDKNKVTEAYFAAINVNNIELFRHIKERFTDVEPIFPLVEFIINRLEAVTLLTVNTRLWDAEIILRSALETFIKLIYITSADKEQQGQRLKEFWNDLAEVYALKQSEQAKKNLAHLGHNEVHRLAYSPIVLPEEEEQRLRDKWPKADRQRLEQRWSFSELILSLSRNYKGRPMEMFTTLAHSYRMASHVSHGDETGILIIRERNSRSQSDQNLVNFAHFLRLMNDSCVYCAWTAVETMHFLNLDKSFFSKNLESLNEVQKLTEKYHLDLFNDGYYDPYRKE